MRENPKQPISLGRRRLEERLLRKELLISEGAARLLALNYLKAHPLYEKNNKFNVEKISRAYNTLNDTVGWQVAVAESGTTYHSTSFFVHGKNSIDTELRFISKFKTLN